MDIIDIMANELKQRNHELLDDNVKLGISFQNDPNNLDLLHKILENNIRIDEISKLSLRVLTRLI